MIEEAAHVRLAEALSLLTEANRRAPDNRIEHKLVQLRLEIFAQQRLTSPVAQPAARAAIAPLSGYGLPVVSADHLTPCSLHDAISSRGALHVRGLLNEGQTATLRDATDATLDAQDACYADDLAHDLSVPWYAPQDIIPKASRDFVRADGCVLAIDSPRGLFQLLDILDTLGVVELVTRYFGERPVLSPQKTTFRRAIPAPDDRRGWHQDGYFLGAHIVALNLWVALTDAGVEAPGLELIPTRLHRFLPVGTDPESLGFCVTPETVAGEFPGAAIRPAFKAGDAIFFDHYYLHRTWRDAAHTKRRYATETWFFAPSAYPWLRGVWI